MTFVQTIVYSTTKTIIIAANFCIIYFLQCDVITALDAFNQQFNDARRSVNQSYPTFLTLYCCGCSTATIPVAQISHYWNIPHVRCNWHLNHNLSECIPMLLA